MSSFARKKVKLQFPNVQNWPVDTDSMVELLPEMHPVNTVLSTYAINYLMCYICNLDFFVKIFSDCFLLLVWKKKEAGGAPPHLKRLALLCLCNLLSWYGTMIQTEICQTVYCFNLFYTPAFKLYVICAHILHFL